MRKAGLASLAFFYCDFRDDQKKDFHGLLSSLLDQLCHQADFYCEMLFKFYTEHANGLWDPSDDTLAGCLKDLGNGTGTPAAIGTPTRTRSRTGRLPVFPRDVAQRVHDFAWVARLDGSTTP
jgi:hypothetical protein